MRLYFKVKITLYESHNKNEGRYIENHSDSTYTIRVNKNFQENYSIQQEDSIKRTLSHEIQHVIQGLERNVKAGRFAEVGGTRQEHLYKLLKRGKLKIYRDGSKKLNTTK